MLCSNEGKSPCTYSPIHTLKTFSLSNISMIFFSRSSLSLFSRYISYQFDLPVYMAPSHYMYLSSLSPLTVSRIFLFHLSSFYLSALQYVNYPTQAPGKSVKIIPVMLMGNSILFYHILYAVTYNMNLAAGAIFYKKHYTKEKWARMILITLGVFIFQVCL
jgi:hypothetical protein